ncbi:unnamed protein product [Rotaria sp. Silwood2]|nr:unnamed protein product [Rotaria sp. Silwood2]
MNSIKVARAGRFGTKGVAITFVADETEAQILNEVQTRFKVQISEMPDEIDVVTHIENQTITHTNRLIDKKLSANDEFPDLSFSPTNDVVKKHRSFVSLLNYFHHNHHQNLSTKNSDKSNLENFNLNNNEFSRPKIIKQKTLPLNNEVYTPVNKSPPKQILPKLASLFHRPSFEQHKYRVGNLKARLHHRRHSPPLTNNALKFQCQDSNELIKAIKRSEGQQYHDNDNIPCQRPVKPVIMKRVHTWHNAFDLRPIDQCLEY